MGAEVSPFVLMELHQYILAALAVSGVYLYYQIIPVARYILQKRKQFPRYLYVILPIAYVVGFGISLVFDDDNMYLPMLIPALAPLGIHFHITKGLAAQVLQESKLANESAR